MRGDFRVSPRTLESPRTSLNGHFSQFGAYIFGNNLQKGLLGTFTWGFFPPLGKQWGGVLGLRGDGYVRTKNWKLTLREKIFYVFGTLRENFFTFFGPLKRIFFRVLVDFSLNFRKSWPFQREIFQLSWFWDPFREWIGFLYPLQRFLSWKRYPYRAHMPVPFFAQVPPGVSTLPLWTFHPDFGWILNELSDFFQ